MNNATTVSTSDAFNVKNEIDRINANIRDALNVMFERALSNENQILDCKKYPPVLKGIIQDCEFGMILITGSDWLRQNNALEGSIANEENRKDLVLQIVDRVIKRVLKREQTDEGGEFHENEKVFFVGEPYTFYTKRKVTEGLYCANLDTAMFIISFLSLALETYDKHLKEMEWDTDFVELDDWIHTYRDVSLYICLNGLKYAEQCIIFDTDTNEFLGFTCNPEFTDVKEIDTHLIEEDRLFFTWTACETISDMMEWRTYVDRVSQEVPFVTNEILKKIEHLQLYLSESANWCERNFQQKFKELEPTIQKSFVLEIEKSKVLTADQKEKIRDIPDYVQNVYHISQYAAIRSLSPLLVKSEELITLSTLLDNIVLKDLIESGLDRADNEHLSRTLTREYFQGPEIDKYPDDAWYPLVIRSIAGLYSRTIKEWNKKDASREEIPKITKHFNRFFKTHVTNLIDRRPDSSDDKGNEKLWSYAKGREYVLYATQRTIFALMKYAECLTIFDKDDPEERLSFLLAKCFAENLMIPAVKDLMKIIVNETKNELISSDVSTTAPTDRSLFPEPDWAKQTIETWLKELVADFRDSKIEDFLKQQSGTLIEYFQTIHTIKIPDDLSKAKKSNAEKLKTNMDGILDSIFEIPDIGPKLKSIFENKTGDTNELLYILFEYMFSEFVNKDVRSLNDLKERASTVLWECIESAKMYMDKFNQL